jgi:5-methylcytosine-specific restriction endonuclease McrA
MNAGGFAPALALNADFRPLNYFPLSLWSWQDTVKAVWSDRVTIISEYDQQISSPSLKMNLPSVIALKEYVPQTRNPAFTRFNVFLRDRFSCQYCGNGFVASELTFDHVIPKSRGGRTSWTNVVAACGPCNLRKANKMPGQSGMHPLGANCLWVVRAFLGSMTSVKSRLRSGHFLFCPSMPRTLCLETNIQVT